MSSTSSYFFSDPLIKDIIEKRLIQCINANKDSLLFRYLQYILDSLPVAGRDLEEDDQYLFFELVEILQENKKNKLI